MLLHRVLTAVALLACLLPALFAHTPFPFIVCAWVLMVLAAWEWARLNTWGMARAIAYGAGFALICLLGYYYAWTMGGAQVWTHFWLVAGALWVLAGSFALIKGVPGWGQTPVWVRQAIGVVVLLVAWLAVAQARTTGVNFLLSAMALVWVADVGAFAGGKALGKHFSAKLAPGISPGKTWVGAVSGGVCSLIVASVWVWVESGTNGQWGAASLPMRLWQAGVLVFVLGVTCYVALAVAGDLIESIIKRAAGAKDSSRLLPGHGGVLDRVDALLPTLPFAMMLSSVLDRL